MKIGVVVFSKTGNTNSVAKRIKEKLLTMGYTVSIEQIAAANDDQTDEKKVQLRSVPDISAYDAIIFGCPVRGFSLSAVMSAYLSQAAALQDKKVHCFVTQYFPFPFMGGKRAIEQMKNKCQYKGAEVCGTGIINWSNPRREDMIREMIDDIGKIF
jgi:flavodoxin